MFATKTSGDLVDHDRSTNSVSQHIHRDKILSAIFYGVSSLAVIFTNKAIMTECNFPFFDFLAAVQFLSTSFVLTILILLRKIDVPYLNFSILMEILPVSFMFLGNVICGLGSTKSLNLPMFTALRRFSILMTMIAEYCFLSSRPSNPIIFSILMMVGGALVAAAYDLSFDTFGYTLVFFNNLFTALNGVWMKKASMSGKCSKMGVLFYNSLFSAVFMFSFFALENIYLTQQASSEAHWRPGAIAEVNGKGMSNRQLAMEPGTMHFASNSILLTSESSMETAWKWIETNSGTTFPLQSSRSLTSERISLSTPSTLFSTDSSSTSSFRESIFTRIHRILDELPSSVNLRASATKKSAIPPPVVRSVSSNPDPSPPVAGTASDSKVSHDSKRNLGTLSKIYNYEKWNDYTFICMFLLASFMGSILNYSIFLCTTLNSALTTAVVGALKNVAVTYMGMVLFGDYNFSWVNFIGINISIAGSLYYTYITIFKGVKGFGGV